MKKHNLIGNMMPKHLVNRQNYNPRISVYSNSYDTQGEIFTLEAIRKHISDGSEGLMEKTEKCRRLAKNSNKAYKIYKKASLPAPTFAGIFPPGKRQQRWIRHHSGLLVLDSDDASDIAALLFELAQRPDIALAFPSPSATGVKLVVRIHPIPEDAAQHRFAFQTCLQYFDNLKEEFGFTFDQAGSDCSRLCYLAHYPQVIHNSEAIPIEWDRNAYREEMARQESKMNNNHFDTNADIKALEYIDPEDYEVWIKIGFACYNSRVPLQVWDKWSQNSDKYRLGECANKWKSFGNNYNGRKITWGTAIHSAKLNGYSSPRVYTPYQRLKIDPNAQKNYREKLTCQEETYNALNKNITHFIKQSKKRNKFGIIIVKYPTGTGKSYTTLTTANELSKKVIGLYFNHKLAEKQTADANQFGFNVVRFKGRGFNFKDSGVTSIPLKSREQNETLFKKYQIMCPIYDKLKPYQDKRLNPRKLCVDCSLLKTCESEGYWSQFPKISKADYVSICMQDLIFNPSLWSFLNILLSGRNPSPTHATNAPPKDFQPFDFAIIDDYTTVGLYTDVRYSVNELAKLKNAWEGTKTGDVIAKISEAFDYLRCQNGTQRTVEVLRKLFNNLDNETRSIVNQNLTQHPKRDEHGNVDPISPWEALNKFGHTLETLAPVWYSENWTLLHQLEVVLKDCQNDDQAPLFFEDPYLILSIPPQVPQQIKAVMLMSATTDIEATKNAFTAQPVDFIVAEGNPTQVAKGVKMFQYTDGRYTTQSIFEYQKNEQDEILYDKNGKPIIISLTSRATKIIRKLTELAKSDPRKSVFTSFKEFTVGPIAELDVVKELHEAFDKIAHYDTVSGMNFEECKIFVNFGYPKADPKVIKNEARKQYRHDPKPLDFKYDETTEENDEYSSKQGRFVDPRVDKIRQQLTIQKLLQTVGRARHTRWEDTITINICAEPMPGFTNLATPMKYNDLMNAQSFEFDEAIAERIKSEQEVAKNKIKRGYTDAILQLHAQDIKPSKIAKTLGITRQAVSRTINNSKVTFVNLDKSPIKYLIEICTKLNITLQQLCDKSTLKIQILQELIVGERKTSEIIAAVDGQPTAVKNELKRLLNNGIIQKVRHGVYALIEETQ